jgi:hypothetical protein
VERGKERPRRVKNNVVASHFSFDLCVCATDVDLNVTQPVYKTYLKSSEGAITTAALPCCCPGFFTSLFSYAAAAQRNLAQIHTAKLNRIYPKSPFVSFKGTR